MVVLFSFENRKNNYRNKEFIIDENPQKIALKQAEVVLVRSQMFKKMSKECPILAVMHNTSIVKKSNIWTMDERLVETPPALGGSMDGWVG